MHRINVRYTMYRLISWRPFCKSNSLLLVLTSQKHLYVLFGSLSVGAGGWAQKKKLSKIQPFYE